MPTKNTAKKVATVTTPEPRAYEHLMVVRFTASQWYPRRFDKKASDDLAKQHGHESAETIGRFNKILVELDSIKPLQKAVQDAMRQHYRRTRPWTDDGIRVMPNRFYLEYSAELTRAKGQIAELARKFARDEYAPQIEAARARLGALFNAEDYPAASEIEQRFGVVAKFEPLPRIDDVEGWGLGADDTLVMRNELRREQHEAIANAQRACIESVTKRAQEFVEKLSKFAAGETRGLYETAITNLRESVVDVIDGMNITGDKALTKFAREIEKSLRGLQIEQLRDDATLVKNKAREVELISRKFDGVFGSAS